MKICNKIVFMLLVFIIAILPIKSTYGLQTNTIIQKEIKISKQDVINPDDYINKNKPISDEAQKLVSVKVGLVLGAMRNIAVIISVFTLMIMGVKYIMGSVEEKANYKKTIIPWIIGVLMVTGGITLVSFIYDNIV